MGLSFFSIEQIILSNEASLVDEGAKALSWIFQIISIFWLTKSFYCSSGIFKAYDRIPRLITSISRLWVISTAQFLDTSTMKIVAHASVFNCHANDSDVQVKFLVLQELLLTHLWRLWICRKFSIPCSILHQQLFVR